MRPIFMTQPKNIKIKAIKNKSKRHLGFGFRAISISIKFGKTTNVDNVQWQINNMFFIMP
jgi:hypothetical protein